MLTKLEKDVLSAVAGGMYAELGFSDVGIEEVMSDTGLSANVVRGVASSLIKKGLIDIDDRESEGYKNKPTMHIWYLTYKTMGLVPHWVDEDGVEPVNIDEL